MNIALLLEMAAEAAPDRIGLVCDGRRWSYAELLNAARGAVEVIRASGASHVALLDESSEAAVIALFGAAMAGVPYCPLNYRLADEDLAALLGRIAPALVIGDTARVAKIAGDQAHIAAFTRPDFVTAAQGATVSDDTDYDMGEGIAVQLFTSGTTAAPKAAILRHSNLLGYILGTVEFAAAEEADAALVVVPPYHIAGISALMSSIYANRRIVMLPSFTPKRGSDWLNRRRDQRFRRADHAHADHLRDGRRRFGPSRLAARHFLRRRQDAARSDPEGAGPLPRHRLHQCLWADRNQLDDCPARPGRSPRRLGQRRSGSARKAHFARPADPHRGD